MCGGGMLSRNSFCLNFALFKSSTHTHKFANFDDKKTMTIAYHQQSNDNNDNDNNDASE